MWFGNLGSETIYKITSSRPALVTDPLTNIVTSIVYRPTFNPKNELAELKISQNAVSGLTITQTSIDLKTVLAFIAYSSNVSILEIQSVVI